MSDTRQLDSISQAMRENLIKALLIALSATENSFCRLRVARKFQNGQFVEQLTATDVLFILLTLLRAFEVE